MVQVDDVHPSMQTLKYSAQSISGLQSRAGFSLPHGTLGLQVLLLAFH